MIQWSQLILEAVHIQRGRNGLQAETHTSNLSKTGQLIEQRLASGSTQKKQKEYEAESQSVDGNVE